MTSVKSLTYLIHWLLEVFCCNTVLHSDLHCSCAFVNLLSIIHDISPKTKVKKHACMMVMMMIALGLHLTFTLEGNVAQQLLRYLLNNTLYMPNSTQLKSIKFFSSPNFPKWNAVATPLYSLTMRSIPAAMVLKAFQQKCAEFNQSCAKLVVQYLQGTRKERKDHESREWN